MMKIKVKVIDNDETPQTLVSSSSSSSSMVTTLNPDIIQTHILSRLDGGSLTALSSTSSQLRRLCNHEELWRKVCTATWPSLLDSIATDIISTFPGGHRSFFSDAFPSLQHHNPSPPPEIICAVDLYCEQGPAYFSRFRRINKDDIVEVRFSELNGLGFVPIHPPPSVYYKEWFEENMRLNWILIDPSQNRAANLSIRCEPLGVQPSISGYGYEFTAVYWVMMTREKVSRVKVECSWNPWNPWRNELCVKRVTMEMMGKEAFIILQTAMQNGHSKIFDAKEKFHHYLTKVSQSNYYHKVPRKVRFRPRQISSAASATNSKKRKTLPLV